MGTIQEIEQAVTRLSPRDLAELRQWFDDYCEDQLELTEEVKGKLDEARADIREGRCHTRRPQQADQMAAALQVWSHTFAKEFDRLPGNVQAAIQAKIDDVGRRLQGFPHQRLTARSEYKLRAGDYRVLYEFDASAGRIDLLYVGNRREIYKRA